MPTASVTLEIRLPKGRRTEGIAIAELDDGQLEFRCLGRSDSKAAAQRNNPTRDPLKSYGDLPSGKYAATRLAPKTPATAQNLRAYGPGPRFYLEPVDGQALLAKKRGRSGLLIHGGPTGAPMPVNALRPTHGCLRVDDASINLLARKLPKTFSVWVREV